MSESGPAEKKQKVLAADYQGPEYEVANVAEDFYFVSVTDAKNEDDKTDHLTVRVIRDDTCRKTYHFELPESFNVKDILEWVAEKQDIYGYVVVVSDYEDAWPRALHPEVMNGKKEEVPIGLDDVVLVYVGDPDRTLEPDDSIKGLECVVRPEHTLHFRNVDHPKLKLMCGKCEDAKEKAQT